MASHSVPSWEPRIRHITGVGIHELVLPPAPPARGGGGFPFGRVGPSSSPRVRRTSYSVTHDVPPLHGRKRAPTLAGEAREGHPPAVPPPTTVAPVMEEERQLARCFIALVLPEGKGSSSKSKSAAKGKELQLHSTEGRHAASPSPVQESPPPSPTPSSSRRRTPSQPQQSPTGTPQSPVTGRSRTTSLPPKPMMRKASVSSVMSKASVASAPSPKLVPSSPPPPNPGSSSPRARPKLNGSGSTDGRVSPAVSTKAPPTKTALSSAAKSSPIKLSPAKVASAKVSPATASPKRPTPVRRSTLGFPAPGDRRPAVAPAPPPPVPFFLSPIHLPSTHPRWANLEPGDFAPWVTTTEGGGTVVDVQVWVEDGKDKWRQLSGVGGPVDLARLVPCRPGQVLSPNTLQWTFSAYPNSVFYMPSSDATPQEQRDAERGVVERSLRETRMKNGPSVGALHQLVNIQSVIADTQKSIDELQARINSLVTGDDDRSTLRRDVSERGLKVRWVRDKVSEVERTMEDTQARIALHRGRVDARRALLTAAEEGEETTKADAVDLERQVANVEGERSALLPKIYRLRAHHAQQLDTLFPIVPLHANSLLYSILGVPLPIPVGPKDPAPPLTLPPALTPEGVPRVDERTTSAALGYAALVVHLISLLGGAAAGLAYPVTYAGSRSHVRDVVSVMNGPRSFPLYGKGVERYRYEYAVFLLNKDIELLMHEADIRMLDLRHTLPNLKNLLLTLSSPEPPPPGPVAGPGWASGAASRASSRQASGTWQGLNRHLRSVSASSVNLTSSFFPISASTPAGASLSTSVASVGPTSEEASGASAASSAAPLAMPIGTVRRSSQTRGVSAAALTSTSPSPGRPGPVPLVVSPQKWTSPTSGSRLREAHTPSATPSGTSGTSGDESDDEAGAESDDTQTEGYAVKA